MGQLWKKVDFGVTLLKLSESILEMDEGTALPLARCIINSKNGFTSFKTSHSGHLSIVISSIDEYLASELFEHPQGQPYGIFELHAYGE